MAKDEVRPTRPKRKFRGKLVKGTAVARGAVVFVVAGAKEQKVQWSNLNGCS